MPSIQSLVSVCALNHDRYAVAYKRPGGVGSVDYLVHRSQDVDQGLTLLSTQSESVNRKYLTVDPTNRLLSRGGRRWNASLRDFAMRV